MPDEEQKEPSQRPVEAEHTPILKDNSIRQEAARDVEVLKASGARPSPNPDTDPKRVCEKSRSSWLESF